MKVAAHQKRRPRRELAERHGNRHRLAAAGRALLGEGEVDDARDGERPVEGDDGLMSEDALKVLGGALGEVGTLMVLRAGSEAVGDYG